ncbi:MAG TPA: serine/threonine-protein kinase, partial [Myxococcaceae bacterium]
MSDERRGTDTSSGSRAPEQAAPASPTGALTQELKTPSAAGHVLPGELMPRSLAGRYLVLDVLGRGGMGTVASAYDTRLDRRVALKLLHRREDTEGALQQIRLLREAQAMARLNHPHVVAVYDAGTLEDGTVFISMELVEGQTLSQWCEAQQRPWRELLAVYLEAGRGLAAAHDAGLVHRDFKPENVLV